MIFKKHLTFDEYGNPMRIETTSIFHNISDIFWDVFYGIKLFIKDMFTPCTLDKGNSVCDCKNCRPF